MQNSTISQFDVLAVPLEGSNLIEASAGTGKTFSIAILVIRLLLRHFEKEEHQNTKTQIYIDQILMVTFTAAAVAELEERVRKYIHIAVNYTIATENKKDLIQKENNLITNIIDRAIELSGNSNLVHQVLKDNQLLLDEANIMTIHSFCQSTLNEFAIETNQLFGVNLFTDTDLLIESELNKFWRQYITVLDIDLLKDLDLNSLRTNIKQIVQYHLDGKFYAFYDENYNYSQINLNQYWNSKLSEIQTEKEEECKRIKDYIDTANIAEYIINIAGSTKPSKDKYLSVIDNIEELALLYKNDKSKIKASLPEDFKNLLDNFSKKYADIQKYCQQVFLVMVYNLAIQKMIKGFNEFLSVNNYITYDGLIDRLYKAIKGENAATLKEKLNAKYKAIFVDEFQDTDKKQYEIFYESFSQKGILFLIGDPKQSIYGWRKADMITYFQARENVDHVYQMNVNFRSSAIAIDAMNTFFKPNDSFDTFYFQDDETRIDYTKVESPKDNVKGNLNYQSEPIVGIQMVEVRNKMEILEQVKKVITQLLFNNDYNIDGKKIEPSDIGIIVRRNDQAQEIKNLLSSLGIPSVMINEDKVITSIDALNIYYLLLAVSNPSISSINRFLMSDLIGMDYSDIMRLDDNKTFQLFQLLSKEWIENGIYPMMMKCYSLLHIEDKWMEKPEGERKLTNFFHLTELLNQIEYKKKYSPEELISWLQKGIKGQKQSGDEYELRMESDENAVKITTIHKSKGLQYNIVLAPFLDLENTPRSNYTFAQFYDYKTQKHVTKDFYFFSEEEKENYIRELERENRRLIYVGITRAINQFFVFHSTYYKKSSLNAYYNSLENYIVSDFFTDIITEDFINNFRRSSLQKRTLQAKNFDLLETNWHKLSFTSLSTAHEYRLRERKKIFDSEYDNFVFDQLRFGANSGNLLHNILEQIDFSSDYRRKEIIQKLLDKYLPSRSEVNLKNIEDLILHVLRAYIIVDKKQIHLSEVTNNKRISELEFDFPINNFNSKELIKILNKYYPTRARSFDKSAIKGLMNGKVDLFFEYDGKYYILDWKSNYLGYNLEDYNYPNLLTAMNDNNYHLQYLIYIVAVTKMLKNKIQDFNYEKNFGGVIYLFLRGIREYKRSGVFTIKPPYKIIQSIENALKS